MSDTTDIEKKSLEAHVELCAERYKFLEEKLETVEEKITGLNAMMRELKDMITLYSDKRSSQLLNWAGAIIAGSIGIIGYLLTTYVFK